MCSREAIHLHPFSQIYWMTETFCVQKIKQEFAEQLDAPKTPLLKGVGSPFRRSGGIRAGSTNSPKTLQNNGVAACGIPPSRLFKATHLPLTREALGAFGSSRNIYLTIVPAATPCVPLERGKSLIGGAGNRPINIYLTVVPRAGCILPLRILTVVR